MANNISVPSARRFFTFWHCPSACGLSGLLRSWLGGTGRSPLKCVMATGEPHQPDTGLYSQELREEVQRPAFSG